MPKIVRRPTSDPGAGGAGAEAAADSATELAGSPEASVQEGDSLERMTRLRQLVRKDGMDAEAAALEVGIDPIIAQLWLRLPDDLWPTARTAATNAAAQGEVPAPPASSPTSGLRRVLTCRIPAPAFERLRAGETPALEAALAALQAGLAQPLPAAAAGGSRFPRRPLALPIPVAEYTALLALAQEHFNNDPREAAGWLIARGLGMALPLPTTDDLAGLVVRKEAAPAERPAAPAPRFVVPARRRPEPRAPLPADDSAPSGDELRSRRDAIGISQRDLAAASGLSRGLVAEVERGRRRHVLTRLRISETLASLTRERTASTVTQ